MFFHKSRRQCFEHFFRDLRIVSSVAYQDHIGLAKGLDLQIFAQFADRLRNAYRTTSIRRRSRDNLAQYIITVKQFNFGVEVFFTDMVAAVLGRCVNRLGNHRIRALAQNKDLHLRIKLRNPQAGYGHRDNHKRKCGYQWPPLAKQYSDDVASGWQRLAAVPFDCQFVHSNDCRFVSSHVAPHTTECSKESSAGLQACFRLRILCVFDLSFPRTGTAFPATTRRSED